MVLAGVGPRGEVLAPVLDPAQRPAGAHRRPRHRDLLGLEHAFVAEAAAHVGRDHPHVRLVEPQELGKSRADEMRHLGGGVHHELVVAFVVAGQHALAFHRRHALAGGAVLAFDDDGGALLHRRDVGVHEGGEEEVVVPLVVHAGGAGPAGGEAVGDRGQGFEVERHLLRDVLGLGPGRGDAQRHALPGEAHLAAGQRRVVGGLVRRQAGFGADRAHAFHVPRGEHAARMALGHGDGADAGVRQRAAHERDLPQPGEGEVAHEPGLAGQMPGVFLAGDAGPDPRGHVRSPALRAPVLRKYASAVGDRPAGCMTFVPIETFTAQNTGGFRSKQRVAQVHGQRRQATRANGRLGPSFPRKYVLAEAWAGGSGAAGCAAAVRSASSGGRVGRVAGDAGGDRAVQRPDASSV